MTADKWNLQNLPNNSEGEERAYEREEKEKRAAELVLANIELAYQNEQKELRAQELIIANKELAFQNEQKEQRAQELVIANKELAYQNVQKEQRALELLIANEELAYQNAQKEQRAQELLIANKELAFQNEEKEQRAQELAIANRELAYQNSLKERRAQELAAALKDLEAFAHVSSHHLQEPLRKIRSFVDRILEREGADLTPKGQYDLGRVDIAAARMSQLIQDIHTYSRIDADEPIFVDVSLEELLADVLNELQSHLTEKQALVESHLQLTVRLIPSQAQQVLRELLLNALKFSAPGEAPYIFITGSIVRGTDLSFPVLSPDSHYYCIEIGDKGIGFKPQYADRIFGMFQKLHTIEEYPGTGIGLAIVKKIMDRHNGAVTASSDVGKGATFRLYFPCFTTPVDNDNYRSLEDKKVKVLSPE